MARFYHLVFTKELLALSCLAVRPAPARQATTLYFTWRAQRRQIFAKVLLNFLFICYVRAPWRQQSLIRQDTCVAFLDGWPGPVAAYYIYFFLGGLVYVANKKKTYILIVPFYTINLS